MFLVRLRTFLEWHLRNSSDVRVLTPTDPAVAAHLADMHVFQGLPISFDRDMPEPSASAEVLLPVCTLANFGDVERVADAGVVALEARGGAVAGLGDAFHMAIAEFGDNAVSHGRSDLGLRLAAGIAGDSRRELIFAIGDLGVGIPEHIRQTNPEWGDDTAAIAKALQPGVSGVRDAQRGYGFLHIQEAALTSQLSAARVEIYSANGFLRLEVVQGTFVPTPLNATVYKRGTWISYNVVSAV
jgi:hypothetical protein